MFACGGAGVSSSCCFFGNCFSEHRFSLHFAPWQPSSCLTDFWLSEQVCCFLRRFLLLYDYFFSLFHWTSLDLQRGKLSPSFLGQGQTTRAQKDDFSLRSEELDWKQRWAPRQQWWETWLLVSFAGMGWENTATLHNFMGIFLGISPGWVFLGSFAFYVFFVCLYVFLT